LDFSDVECFPNGKDE